jgi:serine/threonine-protein kinase
MDLSPRAVISGRYRVDTKVGAGGMGEVWLGEHIAVGTRVAVKTLLPAAAMNHEVVARFKREAYILGRIRSDNVARVVDFVADDVYGLVLVMEFVEGDPLSRLLQERTLTVEEGVDLAVGLAGALKDLHAVNIIHRDLKPGNIIMAPTADGRRRAVVVDFGVSRVMSEKGTDEDEELTGITRADMAVGTIEYMAPEQILNSRNVTPGSDIYAAGAMLFRSCAGRHVHGAVQSDAELAQKKLTTESPPLPLNRDDKLAEGFARVVAKMVKRRPSERYKTADEVLADLLPLIAPARGPEQDSTTLNAAKSAAVEVAPASIVSSTPAAETKTSPATPHANAAVGLPAAPPDSSSVPVSAAQPPEPAAPPRRGVSPVVTFALVAAALAGGVLLGPRLLQPSADPTPVVGATAPAMPPAATATVAPSATAAATLAPPATALAAATAESATPAATTTLVPEAPASAAADGGSPGRLPGPMPKAWPKPGPMGPLGTVPPLTPPPPPKVEPTGI